MSCDTTKKVITTPSLKIEFTETLLLEILHERVHTLGGLIRDLGSGSPCDLFYKIEGFLGHSVVDLDIALCQHHQHISITEHNRMDVPGISPIL